MIESFFNDFKSKLQHPFSLIWKWGLILSSLFWLALSVSPSITSYQDQQTIENDYVTEVTKIDTYLQDYVNSLVNKPAAEVRQAFQTRVTLENISLEEYLNQEHVKIQVYNQEGNLIYNSGDSVDIYTTVRDTGRSKNELTGNYLTYQLLYDGNEQVGYYFVSYDSAEARNQIADEQLSWITMILINLAIAVVFGFGIAYLFLQPIQSMKRFLKNITADNIADRRLNVTDYHGEFTEISEGINQMLDQTSDYIDQQIHFVEDVSHELRTPVAIIEGHLNMLNRWGKDDPEILAESLSASSNELERMKILVQEMLDLSRAGQVDTQYYDKTTLINEVINQVYQNFKVLYPDFDFFLENDLRRNYEIQIYRNHLEQILIILLDNAVKYSADRKEIHISVATNAVDYIEIAVQDFGEGMSQEDQNRVFNRFYRVDKARSRERGGNGLGLSIAKELIKGYKGSIFVESELGNGSIFHVRFPILNTLGDISASDRAKIDESLNEDLDDDDRDD
ncbi:cell wall metabolism sensor histidine kinase WalK [Aerococcus sp. 1KP-2016]|uniref:sensor histidine kinase n=1 Tax=Aerococcus sp. 1KP-2016 TaxID=1981982 RepID=UPI000B99D04D|nr:HAMP domain-containing sensor histidine kinase [Aerococcus sp. 1KP-2016]OYQ64919.1 two-component sensor histidine kinase [Aerococcus sp. 1KP-2016]